MKDEINCFYNGVGVIYLLQVGLSISTVQYPKKMIKLEKCIVNYSAPYGMGHFWKTNLNLRHFDTNPNLLLALWKGLAELKKETSRTFGKKYFLDKLCGKEIYWPSGPNIYLPDAIVIFT